MTAIVFQKKQKDGNGLFRCEIIIDKNNCLGGNKKGNRNFYVKPHLSKGYRVSSMMPVYKRLKQEGYKFVIIY